MALKRITVLLVLLVCAFFGSVSTMAADNTATTAAELTQAIPDAEFDEPAKADTKEPAGECCHTKGVPECGGSCDICCETRQNASCIAGSCNSNSPFACTCDVTTSCTCK